MKPVFYGVCIAVLFLGLFFYLARTFKPTH